MRYNLGVTQVEFNLAKYMSRKFIQTSFVIISCFIMLWVGKLDAGAVVTLITVSLGIFAKADYEEKKLQTGASSA